MVLKQYTLGSIRKYYSLNLLVIKEITVSKDRNVKSLKLKFDENIVKYIVEKGG
jgi:hypothetical protein